MTATFKVIRPLGVLDSLNGVELRREVDDLLALGVREILIDCQDIKFIDSSGLGALVLILKKVREARGRLALCSIIDQIRMLLELTRLEDVFQVFPNREAYEEHYMSSIVHR